MVERIISYFLTEPKHLRGLGAHLFRCGAFLAIAGLIANVYTTAVGATRSLSGQASSPVMIADIFPSLPLWWVPETFGGGFIAVLLILLGLYLSHVGKQIDRFIRS